MLQVLILQAIIPCVVWLRIRQSVGLYNYPMVILTLILKVKWSLINYGKCNRCWNVVKLPLYMFIGDSWSIWFNHCHQARMEYCPGAMETVANELVSDVYGWQLNITIPHNDGRNDGIQTSTGPDQLSRRSGTTILKLIGHSLKWKKHYWFLLLEVYSKFSYQIELCSAKCWNWLEIANGLTYFSSAVVE